MAEKDFFLNEILTQFANLRNESLLGILRDRDAAKLGDAYLNFVYSLALTIQRGKPSGGKLNNKVLAEAIKKSGLRKLMPSRLSRHDLGTAAEALLIHATAKGLIDLRELLDSLSNENIIEALTNVLKNIKEEMLKNEIRENPLRET